MAMKKAELDKQMGLKINGQRKGPDVAGRFGQNPPGVDRREQRRLDAAAGLVPFACKLPSELAAKLAERAQTFEGGLNALVADLVSKGLAS
ncbi:hypothetical protein BH09PSE5_BH09PSE5_21510 [soil metagenome]